MADEMLKRKLRYCLEDKISLAELEAWVLLNYWDKSLSPNVASVLLLLAEYSNGEWSEHELKRELASCI